MDEPDFTASRIVTILHFIAQYQGDAFISGAARIALATLRVMTASLPLGLSGRDAHSFVLAAGMRRSSAGSLWARHVRLVARRGDPRQAPQSAPTQSRDGGRHQAAASRL